MTDTVIVTGSQGFIGSYICQDLLSNGYRVIGIDNYSKYGKVERPHDTNENFELHQIDLACNDECIGRVRDLIKENDVSKFVAGAAMIGGIRYFHEYAYDLLATNERIMANTFDIVINSNVDRIIVISSSMVFESCKVFPSREGDQFMYPPPISSYGFQKLACEYFAESAHAQFGLPYTIVRPFNCIGIGEEDIITAEVDNDENFVSFSHVVPDLIYKCKFLKQKPLKILGTGNQIRHYTHGKDIARGIRMAMESPEARNEDFNIASPTGTTVLELATLIWHLTRPDEKFVWESVPAYEHDVQVRIPDVKKAEEILGFKSRIGLEESLIEIIEWMDKKFAE